MNTIVNKLSTANDNYAGDFIMHHLKATNLSAARAGRCLFQALSFQVSSGEILQILGPNGSGKTTLLRLLSGLSWPESGEIYWDEQQIQQVKDDYHQNLLYLGHQQGVKLGLTVQENLQLDCALSEHQKLLTVDAALNEVGLAAAKTLQAQFLSAGQLQRLALARLLLIPAPLWILDEPFHHLDKQACVALQQRLAIHIQQGGLVVLTSHTPLTELTAIRYLYL